MSIEMCENCDQATGNAGVLDGSLMIQGKPYCDDCHIECLIEFLGAADSKCAALAAQLDQQRTEAHKWASKYGALRGKIQSALIIVDEDRHLKLRDTNND